MAGENINERNDVTQDEMLAAILQKLSSKTNSDPPSNSPPSGDPAASSGAPNPMGDVLASLLSNPDLLAKLPSLLSSMKPILDMLGGVGAAGTAQNSATASAPVGAQSEPASAQDKSSDKRSDSRTALLCAMKPYLSPDRQNAIDYIVKLGRLGDILKSL